MKKIETANNEQLSRQDYDILGVLYKEPFVNQRILAEASGHSLGVVNRVLKNLTECGYLDEGMHLTALAQSLFAACAPKNAVILAAGFGMRMVPINLTTPKAFLEVHGERLIERTIKQLQEAGITDITVVAGFMKDSFEYLIDEFGVDLVVNESYAIKNNLYSAFLVKNRISNTYIIPCDVWCKENPYRNNELYSWYMVSDQPDEESLVRVNRKMELVKQMSGNRTPGNHMLGIAYVLEPEASLLREQIAKLAADERYQGAFWEEALYQKDRMIVRARVMQRDDVVEINTYEQLRDLDAGSGHLKNSAIEAITGALKCRESDVKDIMVLKKGMTNRSFLFSVAGSRYIMRIPGEGTGRLISRAQEAEVFRVIHGLGLCDDPVYINPENGFKITKYLNHVRVCDAEDEQDLKKCMDKLRGFHAMKLQVSHTFDLFGQIAFYESLWEGSPSVYQDYQKTKEHVFSLKEFIDSQEKDWCLTHIDAVQDNFLFYVPETPGSAGMKETPEEQLQLTDWEYAGMQDPHVDIAMFCIYALYRKVQCDRLIDIYFENNCDLKTRTKIYCYIAACGLLWSNWCEYKRKFGVEFGEYSLRQYRFAKDYYRYATEMMEKIKNAEAGGE